MRLSYIVPFHNVEKWLSRCLASICNQGLNADEYEIIAINDGSTDKSMEVLESFIAEERKKGDKAVPVVVLQEEKLGPSVARNKGFKIARGNYIWWVDGDDFLQPMCAKKLLEKAENECLDVLCFGLQLVKDVSGEVEAFEISDKTSGNIVKGEQFLLDVGMPPAAWAAIFRRGYIERHGLKFLEGALHEDQEFTLRAYFLARRIAFVNMVVYNYLQREGSIMKSNNPKKTTDIIKVCTSLWNFAMEHTQIESSIRYVFINRISFLFSQALSNLCHCGIYEFPDEAYKSLPYYPLSINGYLSKKERYKYRLINSSVPLYLKLYRKFVKTPDGPDGRRKLRTHA